MKFLILTLCLLLASCSSAVRKITEEQIDITYAGEITIGKPIETKNGIELDLAFSGGKWMHNSGLCFNKSETTVDDRIIKMSVFTSVCTDGKVNRKLAINEDLKGSYQLVFEDPDGTTHPLTTIEIP
jgi:hypothetical protein